MEKVDIEQEILNKVGKLLLIGILLTMLLFAAFLFGAKELFWHQVDQEVSYQMDKLNHTAFGDIVSRSEVRVVTVWKWTGKIDVLAVRLAENKVSVYVNVQVRGEDTSAHSYHASVTTTDGIGTSWSSWLKNSESK